MSLYYLISSIVSLLLGIVTFFGTNSLLYSLITSLIGLIYFMFLGSIYMKRFFKIVSRYHECYSFINTFIVSLSIKQSVKYSLETTMDNMSESFKKSNAGLIELNDEEKLNQLNQYFKFHIYGLFTKLISLWIEQGGNILEMSTNLVNQARLIETYISESLRLAKKYIFEYAILWVFALAIIVILRFALANFFSSIIKQPFYPLAILGVIILFLLTTHIALLRLSHLEIRGWEDAK